MRRCRSSNQVQKGPYVIVGSRCTAIMLYTAASKQFSTKIGVKYSVDGTTTGSKFIMLRLLWCIGAPYIHIDLPLTIHLLPQDNIPVRWQNTSSYECQHKSAQLIKNVEIRNTIIEGTHTHQYHYLLTIWKPVTMYTYLTQDIIEHM